MLTTQFIRENTERVKVSLQKRSFKDLGVLEQVISLDDSRKKAQQTLDANLSEANRIAKEIPMLFKSGNMAEAETLKARAVQLKEEARELEANMKNAKDELEKLLLTIPNCLNEKVPFGITAEENEVFKDWAEPLPILGVYAKPHWEIMKELDIVDLELGVKITGAGFPVYKNKGAKLQRALIAFFLDEAEKAGYEEMMVPIVVNEASARGTGQLPDKDGQMYYCPEDDLYLIPTAEVPVTNIYRDVIIKDEEFSIKMCGFTPCFRREAGSYGAHVRGLNRLHQFEKVEIVRIEKPENSDAALMEMLAHVEGLLQKLELPYRVLRLCGGDIGFASSMTFDFEVWSAAQEKWLEVSSVSNFETFQSNRMQCRYKGKDMKNTELVHTLNGSALALARIVASILENHQDEKGISIPEALRPYTRFDRIDY